MKPLRRRARLPAQANLFESAEAPPTLSRLPQRHNELIDLLGQLLWQVASQMQSAQPLESNDEPAQT